MCEVQYTNTKKNSIKHSKYIYQHTEQIDHIFFFDVTIKQDDNNITNIRKIKNSNNGILISQSDKFNYNKIFHINIEAINSSNLNKTISVDIILNNNTNHTIYKSDDIYLAFHKNKKNILECSYIIRND